MAVTAQITHLWDTRDVFTDTDHTRSAPHPGLPTHQLIQLSAISVVFGVYHKMTLETAEDLTPGDEYRLSGNRVDARLTPDGRCCTVNIELLERYQGRLQRVVNILAGAD